MIQFFHVSKSYSGVAALSDLSLQISKGEFVYLTGPSGAGKSTLLRLIFCAEYPTSGQILVNGLNVARLPERAIPYLRRNIGVVFQDFKLLQRRDVESNVALALEIMGTPAHETKRRTYDLLRQVGLAHKLHELPRRLSGGEQQRVAIARALVNSPQILLCDEPTGNLDFDRSREIMELLEYACARGTTVIVATHDKGLLRQGNHRVIRLENGRLASEQLSASSRELRIS